MSTYKNTHRLTKTVLRMQKNFSSFFYFTLEANEGVGFYSTLPFEKGQNFRDIVVYTTPELFKDFQNILNHCMKKASIEILEQSTIQD